MNKKYLLPEMEIIFISDNQIITVSGSPITYDTGEWIKPNSSEGGK